MFFETIDDTFSIVFSIFVHERRVTEHQPPHPHPHGNTCAEQINTPKKMINYSCNIIAYIYRNILFHFSSRRCTFFTCTMHSCLNVTCVTCLRSNDNFWSAQLMVSSIRPVCVCVRECERGVMNSSVLVAICFRLFGGWFDFGCFVS